MCFTRNTSIFNVFFCKKKECEFQKNIKKRIFIAKISIYAYFLKFTGSIVAKVDDILTNSAKI